MKGLQPRFAIACQVMAKDQTGSSFPLLALS